MLFYIVTPSFNQLDFLMRCVASVRDQVSDEAFKASSVETERSSSLNDLNGRDQLSVHHHVQDGASTDGTVEWLERYAQEVGGQQSACGEHSRSENRTSGIIGDDPETENLTRSTYTFSYEGCPDNGMYDAISKGWRMFGNRAQESAGTGGIENSGEDTAFLTHNINHDNTVYAWLNCDEQYLPGVLDKVAGWFKHHIEQDVCFGDVLVVDPNGELICARQMIAPSRYHIMTDQLPLYTAAMFIRGSSLEKYGLYPDSTWKNAGDVELVLRMMENKLRISLLHDYVSIFSDTAQNMALNEVADREREAIRNLTPFWVKRMRRFWILMHRFRKWLAGCYRPAPIAYSIYVDDLTCRSGFEVSKPESRWLSRL